MRTKLQSIVGGARIRLLANTAARIALINTSVLLCVLIVAAILQRAIGLSMPGQWVLALVFILVAVSGIQLVVSIPCRVTAALALDRACSTHELFATAEELDSKSGDIPEEIRVRAEAAASDCDLTRAIPVLVRPTLFVVPILLTALLLVIPKQSSIPVVVRSSDEGMDGNETADALAAVERRLTTIRAITGAAEKLEELGIPGLKQAVERGDVEAALACVSAAGHQIDKERLGDVYDWLKKNVQDRELRDRLVQGSGGNSGDLAGMLAEYVAGVNVSDLLVQKEALQAAAAVSQASGGRSDKEGTS